MSEQAELGLALPGPLEPAFRAAGPKPAVLDARGGDNRVEKKNYAQRLSNALAIGVADLLRKPYPRARVTPRADGTGQEFVVGGHIDRKKIDVGVWDDAAGLVAGISIKTYSFRDTHAGRVARYSRNVKRNDLELRDEADVLHRRQPYAVLVALFFLPEDACWDGANGHSSFAHVVFTLRKRAGRVGPEGRPDLFEQVYVGLHREDGHVRFFDVTQPPPRNQPPAQTLSLDELIASVVGAVTLRNSGVDPREQYAADDTGWAPPAGSLPEGLEAEPALDLAALDDDPDALSFTDS